VCAISVIQDYYRQRTAPWDTQWPPLNPNVTVTPSPAPIDWTPETWRMLKEVLAKLEALDAKTGQPHCEDPAKAAWMKDVEARLAALEVGSPHTEEQNT